VLARIVELSAAVKMMIPTANLPQNDVTALTGLVGLRSPAGSRQLVGRWGGAGEIQEDCNIPGVESSESAGKKRRIVRAKRSNRLQAYQEAPISGWSLFCVFGRLCL